MPNFLITMKYSSYHMCHAPHDGMSVCASAGIAEITTPSQICAPVTEGRRVKRAD
jgi:hypothetical protein